MTSRFGRENDEANHNEFERGQETMSGSQELSCGK